MRHYERALAPIRRLRVDWREPLVPTATSRPHRGTTAARALILDAEVSR